MSQAAQDAFSTFKVEPHAQSHIKKVIGVVSGKGGVGKSLVTSLLAVLARRTGAQVGIMDADITGPSIPKAFGVSTKVTGGESGIFPAKSKTGIDIMSLNLLLDDASDPVMWRAPIITSTVKQFWSEVIWEDKDILFVDLPPGTGDVALTVFQSLPVDGLIVVTSPQELVAMIVEKAVKMASRMNVPVLALVENMSGFVCPDCGKRVNPFGESHIDMTARKYNIELTAKIPIQENIARACDLGEIEDFEGDWLTDIITELMPAEKH